MQVFRAALLGLGNISWKFDTQTDLPGCILTHARAYQANKQTTLVGGGSPDPDQREAFSRYFSLPAFESLEKMIDRLNPDIVSICSPTPFHFDQTLACIQKRVPMIWLEKPAADNLSEMDRLIEIQAKSDSSVLVNYQRRYISAYLALKETFQQNRENCRLIQINYSKGLEANGSHMLDLLSYLASDQTDWHLEWLSHSASRDNPSFCLFFPPNLEVMVCGADLPFHNIDISLTFEKGRLSVLHGGMTQLWEPVVEHELYPGFRRLKIAPHFHQASSTETCLALVLKDLLQARASGCQPRSNLISARNSLKMMTLVRKWQAEVRS